MEDFINMCTALKKDKPIAKGCEPPRWCPLRVEVNKTERRLKAESNLPKNHPDGR
jgi:hypothetical protein